MNDTVWLALAFSRLAVRAEMLEQENALLRLKIEQAKGPQPVEPPKDEAKADAD